MRLSLLHCVLFVEIAAGSPLEIQNSTVQSWLDFSNHKPSLTVPNRTALEIKRCQVPQTNASSWQGGCRGVCLNEDILQYGSNNLNNCGLWLQLLTVNQTASSSNSEPSLSAAQHRSIMQQRLSDFASLDLDANDASFVAGAKDAVSAVLLKNVPDKEFSSDTGYQCTQNALFGPSSEGLSTSPSALSRCLDTICYTRTLHPEISGIGVFVAMLMQISIVLLASSFLIISHYFERMKPQQEKVLTACIKFHQDQCFYFTFLSIAEALALRQVIEPSVSSNLQQRHEAVPLLLSVCLPTVFTHLIISFFGDLSWHMIMITTAPILGVIIIIATTISNNLLGGHHHLVDGATEFLASLCGSRTLTNNLTRPSWSESATVVTLAITAFCIMCHIVSTINYWASKKTRSGKKTRFHLKIKPQLKIAFKWIGTVIFLSCFIYQIIIYDKLRRQNFIAIEWTLGQVISSGVWVPAILELFYLEVRGITRATKDQYPRGWEVRQTDGGLDDEMSSHHAADSLTEMVDVLSPVKSRQPQSRSQKSGSATWPLF